MAPDSSRNTTFAPNTGLAWLAIIPLTGSVIVFYIAGWNAVAPALILVLAALTLSTELLKWSILELAERRFKEGYHARGAALAIAALGCLAWGIISGVVALTGLAEPGAKRAAAEARIAGIEAQLDALPTPTPDMPATRIRAMTEANAQARAELNQRLEAWREVAKSAPAASAPPATPLWAKALVAALIEAICFGVPYALRQPQAVAARMQVHTQPPARQSAPATPQGRSPASLLAQRRWALERGEAVA